MSSGVVCRYFANGNCRFGASCWNIHESAPDNRNRTFKNSSYHAQPDKSSQSRRTHFSHLDIQDLIGIISDEAKQVEYGHMWPLTCLSVMANIPYVTGWDDFSMEELRYHAYSAKASDDGVGRFNDYVEYAQNLKLKAKENRLIFLKPGKMAHDLVRKMFEDRNEKPKETSFAQNNSFSNSGESVGSNSFGNSGFSSGSGSVFGFAAKDPAPGLFAMASQGFKSSPFSQSLSQGNDSINDTAMETAHDFSVNFSQPVASSTFQQNIFGAVPSPVPFGANTPTANPFGASSPTANPFGGNPPSANPFGSNPPTANPFGTTPAPGAETSTFPGFGSVQSTNSRPNNNNNNPAYTPLAKLTDAELEQFKATTFTLHNLPLRPPPQELC